MPSAVRTGSGGQAASLFGLAGTGLAQLPRLLFGLLSAAFLLLALALAASVRRVDARRHMR
jgi:hypothetical protein